MKTPDNYENIDNSYNDLLEREISKTSLPVVEGSVGDPGPAGNGSVEEMAVKSDGGMDDLWIKNFIKSVGWKPKTRGFYIDGATGYAEFSNVFVSGEIQALTGLIGGWVVSADALKDVAGTVGMSSAVTAGDDIRFWAGHATPSLAPFRVTEAGTFYASSGTFTGSITGSTGVFSGTMSVAGLTAGTISSKDIVLGITAGTGDVAIRAGKTDFTNTETGFILGLDDSDADKPKFYIGSATNYLNWDGSALTVRGVLNADDITAGTLTGRTVIAKTGTTGTNIHIDSSAGAAVFKYNNTSIGSIASDSTASMLYSSNANHLFYTNSVYAGQIDANGITLPSGKEFQFQSGRSLKDGSSQILCNGDFVPSTDEGSNCGTATKKWNEVRAQVLWQQTNTNGSRMVYDFAYIEMNLLPKRLINKRMSGMVMTNGYVPGLELPFKKGSVLKWTSKGLKESEKTNDFVIAIASDKGLPIVLGAEPVRIIGTAKIGDYIVPSNKKGCAKAVNELGNKEEVIGRCLRNKKYTKEGLVMVMIKF